MQTTLIYLKNKLKSQSYTMKPSFYILAAIILSSVGNNVYAYDLPSVNLGFTTFLDAAPPAGKGFYFSQYVRHYTADRFKDANGKTIGLPGAQVDVTVSLTQGIFLSDQELLGGNLGFNFILPVVGPNLSYDVKGPFPQAGNAGIGDIVLGPFIQWSPIMGAEGPIFSHRLELQFIVPTGEYDRNKEINSGSNFWSFNPYWTGTYFFNPNLTASVRAHYLWNGKNTDPNRGFVALGGRDTRAGQAFHTNFAMEYAVLPQLRVGFNGYFLKQITDTEMNGVNIKDRREQVLGLGVGGMYSFSEDNHLLFNFYEECLVKNRTQGQSFTLRWVHHF
jgi:hypothetical protein